MEFKKEAVTIGTLNGEWTYGTKSKRLLVICHGLNDSNENPTIIAITNGLNDRGHDTFTFNFSENTGGFDIEKQVEDIQHIIEHFKKYNEIVLIAASFSALPAAIATAKDSKISGLITVNGFFGQSALGKDHRKSFRKFKLAAIVVPKYKRIYSYYKTHLKPSEITVPTLVIHAKGDKHVLMGQSKDLYERLTCSKKFIVLHHASHGISDHGERQNVITAVDQWLTKTINTA